MKIFPVQLPSASITLYTSIFVSYGVHFARHDNNHPNQRPDLLLFHQNKDNDFKNTCSCGVEHTQNGSGYTNLLDHLKRAHSGYSKTIIAVRKDVFQGALLKKATVSVKAKNIYGWLEVFMESLESFFFVKKEYIRKCIKLEQICTETLCK